MVNTKEKKYSFLFILSMLLIFFVGHISLTQCAVVANNASLADIEPHPNFVVNFEDGYSLKNVELSYNPLYCAPNNMCLTNEGEKHIKSITKSAFNSNYEVSAILHFKLTKNNERITDFTKLKSVEVIVSVEGGQANTADDAYCAVFVPLDKEKENQVLDNGDYSIFENVKNIAKTENIKATSSSVGENKLNLTMDAESDGFLFIMSIGKNKNSTGTIILISSIMISISLVVLLIFTIRSYVMQRKRKKFNRELRNLNMTEGKEGKQPISAQRIKQEHIKRQQMEQNFRKQSKKDSKSPLIPTKPKIPTKQELKQLKNDSLEEEKTEIQKKSEE